MEKLMLSMLDQLTDHDQKCRRRLVYLYAMAKDHPTARGRKLARREYKSLTLYLEDTWSAWTHLKAALWAEEQGGCSGV